MPPRSTVDLLPASVREALDGRLISSAFGGYEALAAWLASKGHPVSAAAVGRYARRLRGSLDAERKRIHEATTTAIAEVKATIEAARALDAASADDPLLIGAMTGELLVARLYKAVASGELDLKELQTVARTLEGGMKTSVAIHKERQQKAAPQAPREKGLSTETFMAMRQALLGEDYAQGH